MPGKFCAVKGCKSSSILPKDDQPAHFFAIPSFINEDWRRVINKDSDWVPKKSSRICSRHFSKGDIVGQKLRVGAIPIPEPFLPIIQDHSYALNQAVNKISEANAKKADGLATKLHHATKREQYLRKRKHDLESQVTSLENALNAEKDRFNSSTYYDLLSKASEIPSAIFKSYGQKVRKSDDDESEEGFKREKSYCIEMQKFSLTLFSYSRKAYEYLRETMENCLPHPSTIIRWLRKIDGSPGLCDQSFKQLKGIVEEKKMLGQQVFCSFILDEMNIKKNVYFNGEEFVGMTDCGEGAGGSVPASKALVFMVNAINDHFKLTVGHFFVDSMTGKELASLVKTAIEEVNKTGVILLNITCDNPSSNWAI